MLHHVFPTPIREVDLGIDPDQFKTYLNFVEQQNWCEDFDPWGNPHGYTTKIDYKEDILSLDTLKGLDPHALILRCQTLCSTTLVLILMLTLLSEQLPGQISKDLETT